MEWLLKINRWPVFMLVFGLLVVTICSFPFYIDDLPNLVLGGETIHASLVILFFVLMICVLFRNLWIYAVGMRLHGKYYNNGTTFLFFKYGTFFSTLLSVVDYIVLPVIGYSDDTLEWSIMGISICAWMFFSYFAARALKSAELQRDALFAEWWGYFIDFLVYPLGVWLVQPRVNEIVTGKKDIDNNMPLDYNLDR